MQRKLQTTMTVILGLWLAMLPYAGFAVSFALPNDSTETPDTSIAKRYPYLHFVEKDYGASKNSSNLSDEEFYNRAGRMVFPVNKFNLPKKSPLLKELANDVIPMLNRDSIQLLRVELRGAASPEFWSSEDGEELKSDVYTECLGHFMPSGITTLILTSVYDVYDRYDNLIRKGCKATNTIVLQELLTGQIRTERGKRYTINLIVKPTYLYTCRNQTWITRR